MNAFLRSRPWVIFLVLVLPALVTSFIPLENMSKSSVMMLSAIEFLIFCGWLYYLGMALSKALPTAMIVNIQIFRVAALLPLAFILVLTLLLDPVVHFDLFMIGILASILSMLYCLKTIAQLISSCEKNAAVAFADYAGYFFLLWFFPVGIWFVQPRIQKILSGAAGGLTGRSS